MFDYEAGHEARNTDLFPASDRAEFFWMRQLHARIVFSNLRRSDAPATCLAGCVARAKHVAFALLG